LLRNLPFVICMDSQASLPLKRQLQLTVSFQVARASFSMEPLPFQPPMKSLSAWRASLADCLPVSSLAGALGRKEGRTHTKVTANNHFIPRDPRKSLFGYSGKASMYSVVSALAVINCLLSDVKIRLRIKVL